MTHHYCVYGVSLQSDIPFDFPEANGAAADAPRVSFACGGDAEFAAARAGTADTDGWFVCDELGDGSAYLRWSGLYEFLVDSEGLVVRHRPLDGGSPDVLQNFLFGQALSFALVRQSVEPVHAAVIDVGGAALALLGDCTYGKSTLAAALLRAGCRLVSDDLLVARQVAGRFIARAGAGRIKLFPDSARAVLGASGGVPVIPRAEKRVFRLAECLVQRQDVPLLAFVVLPPPDERDGRDCIEIGAISGVRLFRELVKNTFVRYGAGPRRLHHNFSWNTHLASAVEGFELRYPSGMDRLPSVAGALIDHFRQH